MKRLLCLLFLCATAHACDCAQPRYSLLTIYPVKWSSTTITYRTIDVPKKMLATVTASLQKWQSAAPVKFVPVASGEQLTILFDKTAKMLPDQIYLGYTSVHQDVAGIIAHATVAINAKDYKFHVGKPYGVVWKRNAPKPLCDLDGVILHELGHALGLGHAPQPDSGDKPCMCPEMGPQTHWLHADDISGARSLYPAASGDF